MTKTTIGVDISKAALDVFRTSDGATARFSNDEDGFAAFAKWLQDHDVARVIYEPTGPWHRDFEVTFENRLPLVKVNPLQLRRFAQATGTRAKTDAVDARMLAAMGEALDLAPTPPISKVRRELKELQSARTALIKDRTRLRNRRHALNVPLLKRQNEERLKQIERDIAQIDEAINECLQSSPELARAIDIISSIPALSKVSGAALISAMPELGTLSPKQAAALAGLAPVTRQSGQWKGRAFTHGGRKQARDALYMPAIVAIRHNADLKAKYQSLIDAGKPAKVAIVAIMRKLLILANTLIRQDRKWQRITA